MSRADLAYAIRRETNDAIRATERSVRRWEKSEHSPSDGVVPAIARATGREIAFFYGADSDSEDDEEAEPVRNASLVNELLELAAVAETLRRNPHLLRDIR